MTVQYISSKCLRYIESIWFWNRWTHALFWLFPKCSAIFSCKHVIYMRTVLIIRYRLCICSACGFDMGKRVCILATYCRHCRPMWLPYGIHISVQNILSKCLRYMESIWLWNRWTPSTVLIVSNMLCNIFLSTRDLYADCIDNQIWVMHMLSMLIRYGETCMYSCHLFQTLSTDMIAIWNPYERS